MAVASSASAVNASPNAPALAPGPWLKKFSPTPSAPTAEARKKIMPLLNHQEFKPFVLQPFGFISLTSFLFEDSHIHAVVKNTPSVIDAGIIEGVDAVLQIIKRCGINQVD